MTPINQQHSRARARAPGMRAIVQLNSLNCACKYPACVGQSYTTAGSIFPTNRHTRLTHTHTHVDQGSGEAPPTQDKVRRVEGAPGNPERHLPNGSR